MTDLINSNLKVEVSGFVRSNSCSNSPELLYTSLFGVFPICRYNFVFKFDNNDEKTNCVNETYNSFVKIGYKPIVKNLTNWKADSKYEVEELDPDDDNMIEYDIILEGYILFNEDTKTVIQCDLGNFCIYTNVDINSIQKEIYDPYLSKYIKKDDTVRCNVIAKTDYFYLNEFEIKLDGNLDFDLYNDGFEDVHNEIVRSIMDDKNGLYILHGGAGTGKTTYIRHLIKEFGKKKTFVYIPSNLVREITDPSFTSFLMENKNTVFIVEDCEDLVTKNENGSRNSTISDMLNMTDGILADAFEIKFICTFNTDEKNIDEALLRRGRCRMKYEFKNLEMNRANAVANRLGLKEVDKDVSLAELFNGENTFIEKKQSKKIGFRK